MKSIIIPIMAFLLVASVIVIAEQHKLLSEYTSEEINQMTPQEFGWNALNDMAYYQSQYQRCNTTITYLWANWKPKDECCTCGHGDTTAQTCPSTMPVISGDWCDGTDFNHDGQVDMADGIIADSYHTKWLANYRRMDCHE